MRIEFNEAGFQALRTSAAAEALIESEANGMAERANATPSTTSPAASDDYYEVTDASDEDRARKRVQTANPRAARHEAKTQALQRSIGG